jgi:hypothetical protein
MIFKTNTLFLNLQQFFNFTGKNSKCFSKDILVNILTENELIMTLKLNNDNGLQDWKTEHQAVTKCSSNKDLSGNSSIFPRINFGVFGQGNSPQFPTFHTRKCYR